MGKEKKMDKPPYSNTGAQNTRISEKNGLRALIDWASFTVFTPLEIEQICELLGIEFSKFVELENGDKGYHSQLRYGHIQILYNGKSDMGIHINMSGQGCREFEQYSNKNWSDFFAILLVLDVKFTRLDIAIDDFNNYLSVVKMKRYLKRGLVRSRFRSAREMRKTKITDGSSLGDTVYFGSPQSRIQVRFYDKLLERIEAGKEIDKGVTHWIRSEIQLRDERADMAVNLIAFQNEDVGRLSLGILNNYIAFIEDDGTTNKSRWPLAKWWKKFLQNVEKIGLTQIAPDKTIERSYNWINKQVTTTIAMLFEAFNHDKALLQEIIDDGYSKLKEEHLIIINKFKSQRGEKNICFRQFEKEREQYFKRIQELKQLKKPKKIKRLIQKNSVQTFKRK